MEFDQLVWRGPDTDTGDDINCCENKNSATKCDAIKVSK